MNKKTGIIIGVIALLLVVTGIVVYKSMVSQKPVQQVEEPITQVVPPADEAIAVELTESKVRDNTVVLSVSGLEGKYKSLSYELSYETQGVIQGVTSQSLDISGKDSFVRDDIYLGTCSKNVCRPHTGVKTITVNLSFTDMSGQKSQFSKDYTL